MNARIQGYCALCVSRCGTVAVVENGRFVALEHDPSHPTGQAICAKGRAAPELVYHPDRLLYPLKRTRPKGDPDPGGQRISCDEALDLTAARLRQLADDYGPAGVVFSSASPSTSATSDAKVWIERLMRAFGSPNLCAAMELCGTAQHLAAWSESAEAPVLDDPSAGRYQGTGEDLACFGTVELDTPQGKFACRPAFDLVAEACRRISLAEAEAICGVGRDQIEATARMLWEARPVAYYAWSGVEQQTGATDIARAIAQLYALTGCLDDRGGNVLFARHPRRAARRHLYPERIGRVLSRRIAPVLPVAEQRNAERFLSRDLNSGT